MEGQHRAAQGRGRRETALHPKNKCSDLEQHPWAQPLHFFDIHFSWSWQFLFLQLWVWWFTNFCFGFQVGLQMYLLEKLSSLETSISFARKDFFLLFFSLLSVMIVQSFFYKKLHSVRSTVLWFRCVLYNKHFHAAQGVGLSSLLQAVQAAESPAEQGGVWKARNEIKKCYYSELILKT